MYWNGEILGILNQKFEKIEVLSYNSLPARNLRFL
jgi:hypothetical protein